jgi:hypothetical protein
MIQVVETPGSEIDSSVVLGSLALAASHQATATSVDAIQRVVSEEWEFSPDARTQPVALTRVERYLLPDGSVRVIRREGLSLDSSGRLSDKNAVISPILSDETASGPVTGPEYPRTLSIDPTILSNQIVADPADCASKAFCLAVAVAELQSSYVLDPALTGALWEALGQKDGVEILGETRDRLNRPAIAIRVPDRASDRAIIIFAAPDTGIFLGDETVLTDDNPKLALSAQTVIRTRAVVSATRIPLATAP